MFDAGTREAIFLATTKKQWQNLAALFVPNPPLLHPTLIFAMVSFSVHLARVITAGAGVRRAEEPLVRREPHTLISNEMRFNEKLSGNEVYLIKLSKIMMCSKLNCQKVLY